MILRTLTTNERAETPGFTHVIIISANDLTMATLATAQAFTLAPIAKWDEVLRAFLVPVVPFQKAGDATLASTQASVGDGGNAARHVAATELNANGAFTAAIGNTPFLYTAADNLIVTFSAPAAGRSLSELNRGELHVFLSWFRYSLVSNAIGRTSPTKP